MYALQRMDSAVAHDKWRCWQPQAQQTRSERDASLSETSYKTVADQPRTGSPTAVAVPAPFSVADRLAGLGHRSGAVFVLRKSRINEGYHRCEGGQQGAQRGCDSPLFRQLYRVDAHRRVL
jgi:hypothetical protein